MQCFLTFAFFLVFVGTTSPAQAIFLAPEGGKASIAAVLTDAPAVPPATLRKSPAKVVVHLEARELVKRLADGVEYTFWTFGGQVPGKFIRVRVGDQIEFHLDNHPDNKMPHNIDLHAVLGPGGGAVSSFTAPGHSSIFNFTTLKPGLFVYHCATAPVGMHIGNGMYGLIYVEPAEGLSKVDHEFYVMQGEFYTQGAYGDQGLQTFSMAKAVDEKADYVVFNGSVGALSGPNALQAKTGETIRLFIGNGGPNLISSFHIIGEIFDQVRPDGGNTILQNVQTSLIPPSGATIIEFTAKVPGDYILVDHSITRAFNKGAMAEIKVSGPENKEIYSGKSRDEIYLTKAVVEPDSGAKVSSETIVTSQEQFLKLGKSIFSNNCATCHQNDGQGIAGVFPPLAQSDYLNANVTRAIRVVTGGLTGRLIVNGKEFNSIMPAWNLSDQKVAAVLTYVYDEWGNSKKIVTPEMVKTNRAPNEKMHVQ